MTRRDSLPDHSAEQAPADALADGIRKEKNSVSDLAVFGAPPAFEQQIYVGRPNVFAKERLLQRCGEVLDRGWLSNAGPCVSELEEKLADYLQVKHCICTCNGTVALEIAIRAAGLTGEVIVPSFTFIATAHALQWQQITPVFCDIDPRTHTIDADRVEALITPRTTGIIGVHLWGRACNIDALTEIASRRGLKLIFDAAHAFGCTYSGRSLGSFGDAATFSFHATKIYNTIEGGAVVTDDDALAREVRLMKNFGFTGYDQVDQIGTNGKMNEFCAAVGLNNLEFVDDTIEVNRRNYECYRAGLKDVSGIEISAHDPKEASNYQDVVAEIDAEKAGCSRDVIMAILHAENVLVRRYFYPGCHRMEPYRSFSRNAGLLLPETERLAKSVLCLPTGNGIDPNDIEQICRILRVIVGGREELKGRGFRKTDLQIPKYGDTGVRPY